MSGIIFLRTYYIIRRWIVNREGRAKTAKLSFISERKFVLFLSSQMPLPDVHAPLCRGRERHIVRNEPKRSPLAVQPLSLIHI